MSANDYYGGGQSNNYSGNGQSNNCSGSGYEQGGNNHSGSPDQGHQQQYSQGYQSSYSNSDDQRYQGHQQSYQSAYSSQPAYNSPPAEGRPVGQHYGGDYHNASTAPPQHYSNTPSHANGYNNTPSYTSGASHYGNSSEYGHQGYERQEQAQHTQYGEQSYGAQITHNNYPPSQSPAYPPPTNYPPRNQSSYGQQPPQYGYQDPANPQINPQDPADRGVMGALAGGALGGYGGHKINHGIIGTVGGAIAGSKLEDHFKDEKKDTKKKQKKRRGSNSSCSSSSSSSDDEKKARRGHQPHALAGNFSASCERITLDGDYDLIASCRTASGHSKLSSISLNDVLANMSGNFVWARGGHFGPTARHVRLVEGGRVLEAELGDGGATAHGWAQRRIRLDEKITNEDGELKFLG